jgi:hypothetical protein
MALVIGDAAREIYGTQARLYSQKAGNLAFWLSRLHEIWLSV